MSVLNCFGKVKAFVKESGLEKNIPPQRLKEFARQLEMAGGDALTPSEFSDKVQALIDDDMTRWWAKKQAETAITLYKTTLAKNNIKANTESWKADIARGQKGNPETMAVDAFDAWQMGGSNRPGLGTNQSHAILKKTIHGQLWDVINQGLKNTPDLRVNAEFGKADDNAFRELYAIDHKMPGMTTNDIPAREWAKLIKAGRDTIFERIQAVNPWMESAEEYLWKQFHVRERVTADPSPAGKQKWIQSMLDNAGDKTFEGVSPADRVKRLNEMYDRISDGTWGSQQSDGDANNFKDMKSPGGNLMRTMSRARNIKFNDVESFIRYNKDYGPKTIFEGLDQIFNRAADNIASLEKFGPDREATRNNVYQKTLSSLSGVERENFKAAKNSLDRNWRVVTGAQNAPARGLGAKAVQGAMTAQYLAKSGLSITRTLPDISAGASLLHSLDGQSLLASTAELTANLAKSFASSGHAEAQLSNLSMSMKSGVQALWSDMGAESSQPGAIASTVNKVGALNMHGRLVDAWRSTIANALSKRLGDISHMPWSDLTQNWKEGLGRYSIDEHLWDFARKNTEVIDGTPRITPDAITGASDTAAEIYMRKSGQYTNESVPSKKNLNNARFQASLAIGSMLNEHADLAAMLPDTKQRAFMYQDTSINDGWGKLLRVLWQFKTAAVVQSDIYRRNYFSGTTMKGSYAGLASHAVSALTMAAIGEYAHQMLQGKTPENPSNPEFIGKVMANSGLPGVGGDMLIHEFMQGHNEGKTAEGLARGILGPSISTLVDATAVAKQGIQQALDGKEDRSLPGKATKLVLDQVPGQNLIGIGAAWKYYVGNQLREQASQGYLRHVNNAVEETPGLLEDHQRYWIGKPTE